MVIKCTLSVTPENIGYYARQSWEIIPLPEYITKMGPDVIDQQGKGNQIITTYEFDQSKFAESWEYVSEQLDAFRIIPEFDLSVSILDKGREVKWYRITLNQGGPNAGVIPRSRSFSSLPIVARG
jgi:hypothetical protein